MYLIYKIKQAVLFSFWVILPSIYDSEVTALWYHVQKMEKEKKKKSMLAKPSSRGKNCYWDQCHLFGFWGHISSLTSMGACAGLDQMCGKAKTMFKLWNETSIYHRGKLLCLALSCAPPWEPAPITQGTPCKCVVRAQPPLVLSGKTNPSTCVCQHTVQSFTLSFSHSSSKI